MIKFLNTYPILTFEIKKYSDILDEEKINEYFNSCLKEYSDESYFFLGSNEENLYIIYGKLDNDIILMCLYYTEYQVDIYNLDEDLLENNIIENSKYIKVIHDEYIRPRIKKKIYIIYHHNYLKMLKII